MEKTPATGQPTVAEIAPETGREAITLSHNRTSFDPNRWQLNCGLFIAFTPARILITATIRKFGGRAQNGNVGCFLSAEQ